MKKILTNLIYVLLTVVTLSGVTIIALTNGQDPNLSTLVGCATVVIACLLCWQASDLREIKA